MRPKTILTVVILLLLCFPASSQYTQKIRGTVVDNTSKAPLAGAHVYVVSVSETPLKTTTDNGGVFKIEGIPLGRQELLIRCSGYQEVVVNGIIVNSVKEIFLEVEMQEATNVNATNTGILNEMAMLSAKELSPHKHSNYVDARKDPARITESFAGVQIADDTRNDIVIRGNSPSGVLWKLEGVNIPNPNHFAIPGTTGGSVSLLNMNFLSNSNFFTGAFPAEYGNALSGVFDLKIRKGNNEKHEFSGHLGLLGTGISIEGPINKEKRSSYLAMCQISTLQLLQYMNSSFTINAVPKYLNGAFSLNFPLKRASSLSIFGIGGDSDINVINSDRITEFPYNEESRNQFFGSRTGTIGAKYTRSVNKSMYFKIVFAASHYDVFGRHDLIEKKGVDFEGNLVLHPILSYDFTENRHSAHFSLNKKFGAKLKMKAGVNFDLNQVNYQDTAKAFGQNMNYPHVIDLEDWRTRWNYNGFYSMVQPHVQFIYWASEKFSVTGGLTMLYSDLNENTFSPIEPRLAFTYQLDETQKVSMGGGLHSQLLYPYSMFYSNITKNWDDPDEYNLNLGFVKSVHSSLSYDKMFGDYFRMNAEFYYQYLYDIPIARDEISSYSLINDGPGYTFLHPNPLTNAGLGQNYGFELTLEKFFHKGYNFMITASLFDAKYQGSDKIWRNMSYNGRFSANALLGKEFTFKNNSSLYLGSKLTTHGGIWFPEEHDGTLYESQLKPYLRLDTKFSFRINTKSVTHEIALDLLNITGRKNLLPPSYEAGKDGQGYVRNHYQLGFFPIFYYKIDF